MSDFPQHVAMGDNWFAHVDEHGALCVRVGAHDVTLDEAQTRALAQCCAAVLREDDPHMERRKQRARYGWSLLDEVCAALAHGDGVAMPLPLPEDDAMMIREAAVSMRKWNRAVPPEYQANEAPRTCSCGRPLHTSSYCDICDNDD